MISLPKVLLMGLRKSGKSSIQKVVFEGMKPHSTVDLPTTVGPEKATMQPNEFLNFEVWDFPGQNDPFDQNSSHYEVNQLLQHCGVIVFVLDCREQVDVARIRLVDTICAAYRYDPKLYVEVFVHKVDALSEDHQTDLLTFLQRKVEEEVRQRTGHVHHSPLSVSFNLTSIYDHSVFQAFSLVVQRLIKHKLPKINELLQMVNSNCGSDVSYLFLSRSKIFLAVDESIRLKLRSYDLCSDAMEVLMKMSGTYSTPTLLKFASSKLVEATEVTESAAAEGREREKEEGNKKTEEYGSSGSPLSSITGRSSPPGSTGGSEEMEKKKEDQAGVRSAGNGGTSGSGRAGAGAGGGDSLMQAQKASSSPVVTLKPSTQKGAAAITYLSNNMCLYVRELPNSLTMVLVLKQSDLCNKVMIDKNIDICYNAAYRIFCS